MFFVLLTSNLDGSRVFYERLGYPMQAEQHKGGPAHFTGIIDRTVVEIYPPMRQAQNDTFFIGINADDPAALKEELIADFGGIRPEPDVPLMKNGIATLRDPGGTLVRLFPKEPK